MKSLKIILLLNIILIGCVYTYADSSTLPAVLVPPSVRRGYPLKTLILMSDSVSNILVELLHGGSVLFKTHAFPAGTTKNKHIWIGLLGIPSYLEPGAYSIRIIGEGGARELRYRRTVNVINVRYTHEKISLNSSLTELRNRKDPLVKEQTKELIKILFNFDKNALFNTGVFFKPVEGRMSARFGDRRLYSYADNRTAHSIHNGIDFAVPVGTPVHACGDGRVVFADDRVITGKSVIIEHLPEVYSIYYHLSKIDVRKDELVKRGKIIGESGVSGLATGPHLHWEIRVSGVAVDPEIFLKNKIIDKSLILSNILEQ
ncbi:MAG: M23 family metallopeptidase [Spirochaetales bacterium]|nr:M23 family metallopeptidase [Spirochaetales bacterium]